MSQDKKDQDAASIGRWIAVGSELPCLVIAFLFGGQIVGEAIWGPQGRTWGAVIGALSGFVFGVIGIYITIRFYERMEETASGKSPFMPSEDEILKDVKFDTQTDDES